MYDKTIWTENDIQELIVNEVQENINLDYKACDSLSVHGEKPRNELAKDVSAFANSDGGILIYGVIEEGSKPLEIDKGYDPNEISKEWIEHIINSRIKRRIEGIRIYPVELKNRNPGRVVYVISIPQSMDAPHMAHDKKYYKRFNFESIPMEDYEVRDVRRRNNTPNLKIKFAVNPIEDSTDMELDITVYNISSVPAEYYAIRLFIDKRIVLVSNGRFNIGKEMNIYYNEELTFPAICLTRTFSIPNSIPIWEGVDFHMATIRFSLPESVTDSYLVGWQINGPGFMNNESLLLDFQNHL